MTPGAPLLTLDAATLQTGLLGMARLSGLLFLTPPFTGAAVPARVRLGLALALTLPAWSLLAAGAPRPASDLLSLAAAVGGELGLGLTLGFVGRLLLGAASFAAEMVATQIGFGLASALDPAFGNQETALTRLYEWAMLGLFLALDAHYLVLGAAVESFRLLPVGGGVPGAAGLLAVVSLGARLFSLALALVAPTLGILLVTNLVLALASRAVPQLSLMVVGWPVTVLAGLVLLLINVDLMGGVVAREIQSLEGVLVGVLRSLGHGR